MSVRVWVKHIDLVSLVCGGQRQQLRAWADSVYFDDPDSDSEGDEDDDVGELNVRPLLFAVFRFLHHTVVRAGCVHRQTWSPTHSLAISTFNAQLQYFFPRSLDQLVTHSER